MAYVTVYWAKCVLETGFHLEKQALKPKHISEAELAKTCIFCLIAISGWYIEI